jgi:hypothetical protein
MVKKIYWIFIFVFKFSFSQNHEIKVTVENNNCVKCECYFLKNDSIILNKRTDSNGLIKLNDSIYGSFTALKINLGNNAFCKIEKEAGLNNTFSCSANTINLESNTLEEVKVFAQKSIFEDEGSKLIYNFDKELVSAFVSSSDVLKKTPMVSVDINGTPSIRGNNNILIMVNEKLITGLLPSQIIEQIPPNQILKIEVITSPSSKYDAEGVSGIINIVTKTKIKFKSSGYLNVGLGSTGSHLFSNYIYKINNKWTISNYFNSLIYYTKNNGLQSYSNDAVSFYRKSDGKSEGQLFGYQLSVSRTTEKDKLNFNFNYYGQRDKMYESYNTSMDNNISESAIVEKYSFLKFTTDFESKLSEKYKIDLSTALSYLPANNNSVINFLNFENDSSIRNSTFNVDLEGKLSKKVTAEIGIKYNNNLFKITSGTNTFDAKQILVALYLDNKIKISNKINFNFGVRFEEYSFDSNSNIDKKYNNLFANSSINLKLNNKTSLSFLFGQRTQRPSYVNLLPIQSYAASNLITVGNADLNLELSNNYEISFSKHLGNNFIKFSSFYKIIKNKISNYIINSDDYLYTNYINLNNEKDLGISFWVTLNLFKQKLSFNYGLDVIHKKLEFENQHNEGTQVLNNLNITYKISESLYFNLFGNFNTSNVYLQGKENVFTFSNCSLQKDFNKGNTKLALSIDNPLDKGFKYTQNYNFKNVDYSNEITYLNRGIRVFFIYKFGNNKESNNDEINKNTNNENILKSESIN